MTKDNATFFIFKLCSIKYIDTVCVFISGPKIASKHFKLNRGQLKRTMNICLFVRSYNLYDLIENMAKMVYLKALSNCERLKIGE
jgi:hypothetical protein